MAKARTRDSMQALDKLTRIVDGERRIISDPPLIQPIEELVRRDGTQSSSWTGCEPCYAATARTLQS